MKPTVYISAIIFLSSRGILSALGPQYAERCDNTSVCNFKQALSCQRGVCLCWPDMVWDNEEQSCAILLGGECVYERKRTRESVTRDFGNIVFEQGTATKAGLEEHRELPCIEVGHCDEEKKQCVCKPEPEPDCHPVPSSDRKKCFKSHNCSCKKTQDCLPSSLLECRNGLCLCPENNNSTYFDSTENICRLHLNSPCKIGGNLTCNPEEAVCRGLSESETEGWCQCKEGTFMYRMRMSEKLLPMRTSEESEESLQMGMSEESLPMGMSEKSLLMRISEESLPMKMAEESLLTCFKGYQKDCSIFQDKIEKDNCFPDSKLVCRFGKCKCKHDTSEYDPSIGQCVSTDGEFCAEDKNGEHDICEPGLACVQGATVSSGAFGICRKNGASIHRGNSVILFYVILAIVIKTVGLCN